MAYGKFKMGRIKVDPRERGGFQKEPGRVGFEPRDLLTGKKRKLTISGKKPTSKIKSVGKPIFGKKPDGRKTIMPVPKPRVR